MTESKSEAKRQRHQRGEGGRLRDEVIEAAMRILDHSPATQLSLRMVAREIGIAPPSLYRQFADAEEMIKDVVHQCWHQVSTAMINAVADSPEQSTLDRLQAQACAYVRYAMLTPSRYQLLFAPPIGRPVEVDSPVRPASRVLRETIEQHEAKGGKLPAPSAMDATTFTLSLVHGRIALAHLAPERPANLPDQVEDFVRSSIQRLFSD